MNSNELKYQIALTLLHNIGHVTQKNLLSFCGSAEAIFKENKKAFEKIPGIAERTADQLFNELQKKEHIKRAEEEIQFIEKNNIKALFFDSPEYPRRLKFCNDSPVMLYYKGNGDLNATKVVSVVGTRSPTDYGKKITEDFIKDLSGTGILVISGLAYGIDVLAHRKALDNDLDTVGVVAHGLDRIYPQVHENIAFEMQKKGGILTDYLSNTNPDRENFPSRNRIVAGMCDAIVVIETKLKGGSLITAEIANSYGRDVFAFPGRVNDEFSGGCNAFIKRNKAALIENASDLLYAMNWTDEKKKTSANKQIPLLIDLTEKEQKIADAMKGKQGTHIDEICYGSGFPMSEVASTLLQMEFNNIVKSLPGKMYQLNN